MPIFDPLRFSSVSVDVLVGGRASAQALAELQSARLSMLIAAAQQDTRFYREHLHGIVPGLTPLRQLPLVSRHALMDRFDDWVADRRLKLSALRALTADLWRIAFVGVTSGHFASFVSVQRMRELHGACRAG